ncbi:hypothetical protein IJG12_02970 [Candidatus Saccharibacteria bacterium]|nr:hypothetical protein [Candidatus Saccharibacteria bacterium]
MENQIDEPQKEFYECLERGEEIEFTYNNKNYTIQPKNNKYEIWLENQGKILSLESPKEALNNKFLNGESFLEAEAKKELSNIILF